MPSEIKKAKLGFRKLFDNISVNITAKGREVFF